MAKNSFLKLILDHIDAQKTGVLQIKKDQVEKNIYFKKGKIIFLDSSLRSENLGRMLVDKGKITEEQFQKVLERVKGTGKRQGEALVELGFLSPCEVFETLKDQLAKKISNCFLLKDFEYEFDEGEKELENITEIPINLLRTLLDGVQTAYTHDVLKEEGGFSKDLVPLINQDAKNRLNEIRLKPEEVKLIRLFNDKTTLFDIVKNQEMDHQFILSTVFFLNAIGVVKYARLKKQPIPGGQAEEKPEERRVAQPPQEDTTPSEAEESLAIDKNNPLYDLFLKIDKLGYPELFGLSIAFKKENLKKNYEGIIRKYKLDRIDETYKDDTRKIAEKILNRVVKAFTVLKDDKKKEAYLKERAKISETKPAGEDHLLSAEVEMNMATMYRKKNNFKKAEVHLRKAVEYNPNENDYLLTLAETLMNLHQNKPSQIPKEVESLLKKILSLDQGNVHAFLNLGIYYKLTGDRTKATNCFNKVLEIAPSNPRANAELRLLNIRGEKKPLITLFSRKAKKESKKKAKEEDDESE